MVRTEFNTMYTIKPSKQSKGIIIVLHVPEDEVLFKPSNLVLTVIAKYDTNL